MNDYLELLGRVKIMEHQLNVLKETLAKLENERVNKVIGSCAKELAKLNMDNDINAISEFVNSVNIKLEALNLSAKVFNSLKHYGYATVGDIVAKSNKEIECVRGIGKITYKQLEDKLKLLGVEILSDEEIINARKKVIDTVNIEVADLELSFKTLLCLDNLGIKTVGDFLTKNEERSILKKKREKQYEEVNDIICLLGFELFK